MRQNKTHQDMITFAMKKLQWNQKKVMSWYKLENPHLGGARPEELVNRGESKQVIAFLERREQERKNEQSKEPLNVTRGKVKK